MANDVLHSGCRWSSVNHFHPWLHFQCVCCGFTLRTTTRAFRRAIEVKPALYLKAQASSVLCLPSFHSYLVERYKRLARFVSEKEQQNTMIIFCRT